MRRTFARTLPLDVWRAVAAHLSVVDQLRLFWALWQEGVLPFDSVVDAFRDFAGEPPRRGGGAEKNYRGPRVE